MAAGWKWKAHSDEGARTWNVQPGQVLIHIPQHIAPGLFRVEPRNNRILKSKIVQHKSVVLYCSALVRIRSSFCTFDAMVSPFKNIVYPD